MTDQPELLNQLVKTKTGNGVVRDKDKVSLRSIQILSIDEGVDWNWAVPLLVNSLARSDANSD